jgi:hypothetical protein
MSQYYLFSAQMLMFQLLPWRLTGGFHSVAPYHPELVQTVSGLQFQLSFISRSLRLSPHMQAGMHACVCQTYKIWN